jgi:NAD(P)-dependent dehydrogenase (short-subunit alcohol dehydrogenase family)
VDKLLQNKVAVITGSGSGVGRAAAVIFARHGARVVCADIHEAWAKETVSLVEEAGGEAVAVGCDVSDEAAVKRAVDVAVSAYGRLDVMYNNAGIASPSGPSGMPLKLAECNDDHLARLAAVNLSGVVHGCRQAILRFQQQGGGGTIVNTASVAGLIGWGGVLYGSTKGAVVNLTRLLAMEVAKEGIRVNSVCPAGMITKFGIGAKGPLPDSAVAAVAAMHPMGKVIDPADTANAALFLASDLASNITGVNLPVDGGLSAGRSTTGA